MNSKNRLFYFLRVHVLDTFWVRNLYKNEVYARSSHTTLRCYKNIFSEKGSVPEVYFVTLVQAFNIGDDDDDHSLCQQDRDRVQEILDMDVGDISAESLYRMLMYPVQTGCQAMKRIGKKQEWCMLNSK